MSIAPLALLATLLVTQPVPALTGRVVDPSNGAIQGATVELLMEERVVATATTGGDGRFSLPNAPTGSKLLRVSAAGFATETREMSMSAPMSDLTIQLRIAGVAESIAVSADAYRAATSSTGTKLDLSPLETAESVTTIPRALLQDRGIVRLSELAGHVAGVQPLTGYTGTLSNSYIMRGFSPAISYTTLRNGFAEYSFLTQRDVINIDRVEFLKGPASLLYGANDVGGVVNTITKQPLATRHHEIGLTAGVHGHLRPTVDLTGPVDAGGTLRYRFNAAHDRGRSYRDLVDHENRFVAPALTWSPTTRTTVGAEVEWGRFDNDFDRGFVVAPEFIDMDPALNYGEPWTTASNRQVNTMINVNHRVNDRWRVRIGFNHIRNATDNNAVGFGFTPLAADRRTINRDNFVTHEISRNYNSQNELYGTFDTGAIAHQLVTGVEAAYYQFKYTFDFNSLASIDRLTPVHGARPGFRLFGFNDDSFSQSYALFVQDQMSMGRLRVLLGARASALESTARDYVTEAVKNEQADRNVTPRAGVVYQLAPATSVYASLANSFQPNFAGRSRTGEQFSPTRGRQYEAGVKQSLAQDRLLATLAVYHITKRDVLVPDPEDFTFSFSIQIGEQRSRGLEAEVTGAITPAWKIVAAYSHVNAIVSADPRPEYRNQRLAGSARNTGSIYSRYDVRDGPLAGFSAGAGLFIVGDRFATLPNPTWIVPGYARIDADLGYRRDRWRLDLALKNLNDERYFEVGGFGSFMPQAPRHALASLHVLF